MSQQNKSKLLHRIRHLDQDTQKMANAWIKDVRRTEGAMPDDQRISEFLDRLQRFYETGLIEFG